MHFFAIISHWAEKKFVCTFIFLINESNNGEVHWMWNNLFYESWLIQPILNYNCKKNHANQQKKAVWESQSNHDLIIQFSFFSIKNVDNTVLLIGSEQISQQLRN